MCSLLLAPLHPPQDTGTSAPKAHHTSLTRGSAPSWPSWRAVREMDSFSGSRFSKLKPGRGEKISVHACSPSCVPSPEPTLGGRGTH